MLEDNLYTEGIIFLPPTENYHGIEDWNIVTLPENDPDITLTVGKSTVKIPESFITTMSNLSNKEPIDRINKFGIKDKHPIVLIARFERKNEGQRLILESLKPGTLPINDNHRNTISKNWVSMTLNQKGIHLFHQSLRKCTVTIGSESFSDAVGTGEFLFQKAQIDEVMDWLAKNGGVKRFPRWVIIAYDSAEEGVTFNSTYTGYVETDANIHLTDTYNKFSNKTSASDIEQATGRLNGNHGDNMSITAHVDQKTKEILIKSHALHDAQILALCRLGKDHNDVKVTNAVRNMPVFINHVHKNYCKVSGASNLMTNKIKNPNTSLENESLRTHTKAKSTLMLLAPEKYEEEGAEFMKMTKARKSRGNAMVEVNEVKEIKDGKEDEYEYEYNLDLLSADCKEKDENKEEGICIPVPPVNTSLHRIYNNIVSHIKGRGWVTRASIRNKKIVTNSGRFDELQTSKKITQKGLVYRNIYGYEYTYLE
jgi:hypothetical protein